MARSKEEDQARFQGLSPDRFAQELFGDDPESRVSASTIRKLIRRGVVAAIVVNPLSKRPEYRIPRTEVERYRAKYLQAATGESAA